MLAKFRQLVVRSFRPIMTGFSSFQKKQKVGSITDLDIYQITKSVESGAVILSLGYGHIGNVLIPGHWSHAALVVDDEWVIEALGRGVVKTRLKDFLKTKDEICVMLPKFADISQQVDAVIEAEKLVGMPYDWEFEPNDEQFYCFELVWHAYDTVIEDCPFQRRKIFGVETILGDDFIESGLWQTIFYLGRDTI